MTALLKGQDARLAGVLVQCPALAHMDLSGNDNFRDEGTERHRSTWTVCSAGSPMSHLDLSGNKIGDPIIFKIRDVVQCGASLSLSLSIHTYTHTNTYV